MQAVLRLNTFDPDKLAKATEQLDAFDRLHAAQPGYLGNVTVDLGEGRRFVMNLWDSEEHQRAGREALASAVEQLVVPLLDTPSELIAEGRVIRCDLRVAG